jgi:cytosine/adenosine deaminase-related metal-dependent hydrolase
MASILIRNGTILTMDKSRRVIEKGAVAIENDKIIDVGPAKDVQKRHKARKVINAENKVIMPGLIDSHGHAGHGLIKTIGENDPNWNPIVADRYNRFTTEDFWYVESLLSALEKVKFGTTCAVTFLGGGSGSFRSDDPVYAEKHIKGVMEIGIRGIVGLGPSGRSFPFTPQVFSHWQKARPTQREVGFEDMLSVTEKVVKKWNDEGDGRVGVKVAVNRIAPSEELSQQDLETVKRQAAKVRELASRYKTGIIAHASGGGVKLAKELNLLGPDVSLSHSTGLSDEEIKILSSTGTTVVHCPRARSPIRDRCPVIELLEAGVRVVIGSDGNAPDRSFNLFDDMRQAMNLQRVHFKSSNYMPPGKVLEMVTVEPAKALHLDHLIGSIEVGKKADIIVLNMLKPHLVPIFMIPQRVVYEASGLDVDTVVIDGKVVMENRRMSKVNEREVLKKAQKEAEKFVEAADLKNLMGIPPNFWGSPKY